MYSYAGTSLSSLSTIQSPVRPSTESFSVNDDHRDGPVVLWACGLSWWNVYIREDERVSGVGARISTRRIPHQIQNVIRLFGTTFDFNASTTEDQGFGSGAALASTRSLRPARPQRCCPAPPRQHTCWTVSVVAIVPKCQWMKQIDTIRNGGCSYTAGGNV